MISYHCTKFNIRLRLFRERRPLSASEVAIDRSGVPQWPVVSSDQLSDTLLTLSCHNTITGQLKTSNDTHSLLLITTVMDVWCFEEILWMYMYTIRILPTSTIIGVCKL